MTKTNQTLCNVCSETCGFLLSLRHLPDSAYAVLPPFAQGSLLRCFSVRVGQGWAQSLPPPPVLPGVPTATSGPWLSSSFGTSVPCPLLPSPLLFSGLSTLLEQGHTLTSGPWHVLFHLPRRLFPLQIPLHPPSPPQPVLLSRCIQVSVCKMHSPPPPDSLPAAFSSVTLIMTRQATHLAFGLSPHQRDLFWDKNVLAWFPVVFPWHLESRRTKALLIWGVVERRGALQDSTSLWFECAASETPLGFMP